MLYKKSCIRLTTHTKQKKMSENNGKKVTKKYTN